MTTTRISLDMIFEAVYDFYKITNKELFASVPSNRTLRIRDIILYLAIKIAKIDERIVEYRCSWLIFSAEETSQMTFHWIEDKESQFNKNDRGPILSLLEDLRSKAEQRKIMQLQGGKNGRF